MITVLADPVVGGTFLTWSLHFLAGHTGIFSARQRSFLQLPQNPITGINAHIFQPNQPNTIDSVDRCLKFLSNIKTDHFHTVYLHNLVDCDRSTTGTTAIAINKIKNISDKIIYLSLDKKHALYRCQYKTRALISGESLDQYHKNFINNCFAKEKQNWNNLELTNQWDYREFLALNVDPFDFLKITDVMQIDFKHYYIDSFNLYGQFELLVDDLCNYLNFSIDPIRKLQWLDVYQKWQQLHKNQIQFVYYFDTIIDYILKENYFDLTRLHLDIMQEAAIQHCLIYKHNLNLKTWQLEKFKDTQQLHSLLEPNIHKINN